MWPRISDFKKEKNNNNCEDAHIPHQLCIHSLHTTLFGYTRFVFGLKNNQSQNHIKIYCLQIDQDAHYFIRFVDFTHTYPHVRVHQLIGPLVSNQ